MSKKNSYNREVIKLTSKGLCDLEGLEEVKDDHERFRAFLIEKKIIKESEANSRFVLQKYVDPIEVESNILWLPLFYYGKVKIYELYTQWTDKEGHLCYVRVRSSEEYGVLTAFDRDVYLAVCRIWKRQGKKTVILILWRELAEALNLDYTKNLYRIKKSIKRLQNVKIDIRNAFRASSNGRLGSIEDLTLLQSSMFFKEMNNKGIFIEFPEGVRENLYNNASQLIDAFTHDELKNQIHKRMYEFLQVYRFKMEHRQISFEEMARRIPLYNKNSSDCRTTIINGLKKLTQIGFLKDYNVLSHGKCDKYAIEITYDDTKKLVIENSTINSPISSDKKTHQLIELFVNEHNRRISDHIAQESAKKNTQTHNNKQEEPSKETQKQYSVEVRKFKDDLNHYLEINSIGLELVYYWLNAIGINILKEFVAKTKEKARDRLGRHGYLIMTVNTYIKNNNIVAKERDEFKKETVVNKEQKQEPTKETCKSHTTNKQEDENWYIDTVAYDKDIILERSVLISLFGYYHFFRLIEAVVNNNAIFGIDNNKMIKNDKGVAVLHTSWFIKDNPDMLEVIKQHLIEYYPINTSNKEEPVQKEELIQENKEIKQQKHEEEQLKLFEEDQKNGVTENKYVEILEQNINTDIEEKEETNSNIITGKQLREARKKAGMNQAELANKLNISQRMVSHWENNGKSISERYLDELHKILF